MVLIWSTLSLALALTIEYTVRLLKTTLKDPVHSYAAVFCSYICRTRALTLKYLESTHNFACKFLFHDKSVLGNGVTLAGPTHSEHIP